MPSLANCDTSEDAVLDIPVVCTLTDKERAKRQISIAGLVGEAQESVELQDGYSLRFEGSADHIARLTDMIVAERACCLFFSFELSFTPNLGPVWLRIRGPAGVKDMVAGLLPAGLSH